MVINRCFTCKHDNGFTLQSYMDGVVDAGWYCNRECGYMLNFDPFRFTENTIRTLVKPRGRPKSQVPMKGSKY